MSRFAMAGVGARLGGMVHKKRMLHTKRVVHIKRNNEPHVKFFLS